MSIWSAIKCDTCASVSNVVRKAMNLRIELLYDHAMWTNRDACITTAEWILKTVLSCSAKHTYETWLPVAWSILLANDILQALTRIGFAAMETLPAIVSSPGNRVQWFLSSRRTIILPSERNSATVASAVIWHSVF